MHTDHSIRRLRRAYGALLRLYTHAHYERFGEEMERTFADVLFERARQGKPLLGRALSMFADTVLRIFQQRAAALVSPRSAAIVAGVTVALLSVPLVAMQFTDEVRWTAFDFLFAGVLVFGTGLACAAVLRTNRSIAYRAAMGLALAGAFMLVWANGAVGVIGNGEEDFATALYVAGTLAVGVVGAVVAQLRPRAMGHALLAVALYQSGVAGIALAVGWGATAPSWPRDVLMATAFLDSVWIAAAMLFFRAARAARGEQARSA